MDFSRSHYLSCLLAVLTTFGICTCASYAQDIVGDEALLDQSVTSGSTLHDVSGIATVTGPHTIDIDEFTYNGGGLAVYFYVATADSATAIPNGVIISPNILGQSAYTYPNPTTGQLTGAFALTVPSTVDLSSPANAYDTISVWCVVAHADFASNVFAAVPEPGSASLLLMGAPLLLVRRRGRQTGLPVPE